MHLPEERNEAEAIKLIEKYHDDPTKWFGVSLALLKKSEPNYFCDPIVELWYSRREEHVNYHADILSL